jgi:hypothetical protein
MHVRKVLSQSLSKPKPLYDDRRAHHNALAKGLRVHQTAKRTKTQEKRKATLAAKKAQKRSREEAMEHGNKSESDCDGPDKRQRLNDGNED